MLSFLLLAVTGVLLLMNVPPLHDTVDEQKGKIYNGASQSSHKSCEVIGIQTLNRVELHEKRSFEGQDWLRGYYPYPRCTSDFEGEAAFKPWSLMVVTVMDVSYVEVLPTWTEQVKAIGAKCFVVAMDVSVCQKAERLSCGCSGSTAPAVEGSSKVGWHEVRVKSVKERFEGALNFLEAGYHVFMHDADVLFETSGMKLLLEYIKRHQQKSSSYDFMIQDNGSRDTAYDGLNWGFAWMSNTTNAIATLRCTLERWNDSAFGCPAHGVCNSYYKRSQPRINHILELGTVFRNVSACKLPDLSTFKAIHMTGYPTVAIKLTCAKSLGYIRDTYSGRIAYRVPNNSKLSEQRRALIAALNYARTNKVKVEIPEVFYSGRKISFCDAFDVSDISPYLMSRNGSSCAHHAFNVTGVSNETRFPLFCARFENLLKETSSLESNSATGNDASPFRIPICDPHNPKYKKFHCCQRVDGSDELSAFRDEQNAHGSSRRRFNWHHNSRARRP